MGSGVPFDLSAANVPLEEDVVDIPGGSASQLIVLVTELLGSDLVTQMVLTAKIAEADSDLLPTSILVTITPTLTAAGQITATKDPTVWQGVFLLSALQTTMLLNVPRIYDVKATVNRGGVLSTRVVQTGVVSAQPGASDPPGLYFDGNALADGTYLAGGVLAS